MMQWKRQGSIVLMGIVLLMGVGFVGQGCVLVDLRTLELPSTAIQAFGLTASGSQSDSQRVVVLDVGTGWMEAARWDEKTRKSRCLQMLRGIQAAFRWGASVVGVDLLLGRMSGGNLHTCAPRTQEESALWRWFARHKAEQIVLPMSLRMPRYIQLKGMDIRVGVEHAVWGGKTRSARQIELVTPVRSLRHNIARGLVTLFAEAGAIRRSWPWLRFVDTSERQQRLPTFAWELVRLARQRAALQGRAVLPPPSQVPSPIRWAPQQVQVLSLQHLHHPPPSIKRLLRHAVVLIGAVTDPMRDDLFATPMGVTPGVIVHGHIVATGLFGPHPHRGAWFLVWGTLLLLLWVGSGLGRLAWRWPWRLTAYLGALGLFVLLGAMLYTKLGWLPPMTGGVLLLTVGFGLGGISRARQIERGLRQMRDEMYWQTGKRRLLSPQTDTGSPKPKGAIALALPRPIACAYQQAMAEPLPLARLHHTRCFLHITLTYCVSLAAQLSGDAASLLRKRGLPRMQTVLEGWLGWQDWALREEQSHGPHPAMKRALCRALQLPSAQMQHLQRVWQTDHRAWDP